MKKNKPILQARVYIKDKNGFFARCSNYSCLNTNKCIL